VAAAQKHAASWDWGLGGISACACEHLEVLEQGGWGAAGSTVA
jgi:hypothetical protein